uniref:Secreted protein n=1 Tax=Lepeophtheirus salmonis TaxID=72036 RepID=A0A0K2UB17_LEPSM
MILSIFLTTGLSVRGASFTTTHTQEQNRWNLYCATRTKRVSKSSKHFFLSGTKIVKYGEFLPFRPPYSTHDNSRLNQSSVILSQKVFVV